MTTSITIPAELDSYINETVVTFPEEFKTILKKFIKEKNNITEKMEWTWVGKNNDEKNKMMLYFKKYFDGCVLYDPTTGITWFGSSHHVIYFREDYQSPLSGYYSAFKNITIPAELEKYIDETFKDSEKNKHFKNTLKHFLEKKYNFTDWVWLGNDINVKNNMMEQIKRFFDEFALSTLTPTSWLFGKIHIVRFYTYNPNILNSCITVFPDEKVDKTLAEKVQSFATSDEKVLLLSKNLELFEIDENNRTKCSVCQKISKGYLTKDITVSLCSKCNDNCKHYKLVYDIFGNDEDVQKYFDTFREFSKKPVCWLWSGDNLEAKKALLELEMKKNPSKWYNGNLSEYMFPNTHSITWGDNNLILFARNNFYLNNVNYTTVFPDAKKVEVSDKVTYTTLLQKQEKERCDFVKNDISAFEYWGVIRGGYECYVCGESENNKEDFKFYNNINNHVKVCGYCYNKLAPPKPKMVTIEVVEKDYQEFLEYKNKLGDIKK